LINTRSFWGVYGSYSALMSSILMSKPKRILDVCRPLKFQHSKSYIQFSILIFAPKRLQGHKNKYMTLLSIFFGFMGGYEWVLILLAVLLLFGGKKIPELMRGLGSGIKEFKDAAKEEKDKLDSKEE
jgi:sec-independent protein translocase protein TatA